jgi:hypothetical protein
MVNSKYVLYLLWIMPVVVVLMVIGLDVVSALILTADVVMVGGAGLIFKPEIAKTKKTVAGKIVAGVLKNDDPMRWLFVSTRFFSISLFASLASLLLEVTNIEIYGTPPVGLTMFVFAVIFCVMGFIFIMRIWGFLESPSSKTNVTFGKLFKLFIEGGLRISLVAFMATLQVFNAIMLTIIFQGAVFHDVIPQVWIIFYVGFALLSFITMIPVIFAIINRLNEQMTRWDKIYLVSFLSPWIMLSLIGVLLRLGIAVP